MTTTILLKDCHNKTLSVEIRLHRDSNSRWVTDSTLEVMKEQQMMLTRRFIKRVAKQQVLGCCNAN